MKHPATDAPFTGAVASPHAAATDAGVAVLAEGGSAIDAAITTAAMLTVVYPHNVTLGGDLIALVRTPDGAVNCVNASGWSGLATDADSLRQRHGSGLPLRGADTVTVPGGVRGWEQLHAVAGRMPWDRLMEPACAAARQGVATSSSLAAALRCAHNEEVVADADFRGVFAPDGELLDMGDTLHQPALAATFDALRTQGPDAFYRGPIAASMINRLRAGGSALDVDDLAQFRAECAAPIATSFGGLTVMTSPPNSHGFILLRALKMVEESDIADPLGAGFGALISAFADGNRVRSALLADPGLGGLDAAALMDVDAPGGRLVATESRLVPRGDTVGIAAADSDGYAVSLIQSVFHAFGSGVIDPATGVLFQNRGTSFDLDASSPNVIAPRKRPRHTLTPALTLAPDGGVRHVLSTMGGQGQPQILAQLLIRCLSGQSPAAAVAAPRAIVGVQVEGNGPETVAYEADIEPMARLALAETMSSLREVPRHTEAMGHSNMIVIDGDMMSAATDPRSDGAATITTRIRKSAGQ